MGHRVEVALLGGFRVEVDQRPVAQEAWKHRRGADLVKLLALAPGHRLHREQVMDALWPERDPETAAANLRKAVHHARRAFGAPLAIEHDGAMLALWPDAEIGVDLERFEAEAEAAIGNDDLDLAEAALALYRGEVLPGDAYEQWTTAPRDRARLAHLRLLRKAGLWERLVDADPADEEAHRQLMRAHLDAGNRQAAIRQFVRMRDALREELGVSPDAESVELYERVLAMDGSEPVTQEDLARAAIARGLVEWNRKDLTAATRSAEEARRLAIDAASGRELGEASALLGLVAHAQGKWRERFREEFVDMCNRQDELVSAVFDAHLCFGEFSLYGPEGLVDVDAFARDLLALAEESGSIQGRGLATLMLGESALLGGRLEEAEEYLARAEQINDEAGRISAQALSLQRLGELAIARRQRTRAARTLARAGRLAERSELSSHLRVRVLGARLGTASSPDRAMTLVREAEAALERGDVCEPCSMTFRVAAATASARAGDRQRAERYLESADRLAGMWQGGPWVAAVWEARGELRLAEGARDRATALFGEAAEAFARAGRPLEAERCRAAASAAGA